MKITNKLLNNLQNKRETLENKRSSLLKEIIRLENLLESANKRYSMIGNLINKLYRCNRMTNGVFLYVQNEYGHYRISRVDELDYGFRKFAEIWPNASKRGMYGCRTVIRSQDENNRYSTSDNFLGFGFTNLEDLIKLASEWVASDSKEHLTKQERI
jgi:hypothetical protein